MPPLATGWPTNERSVRLHRQARPAASQIRPNRTVIIVYRALKIETDCWTLEVFGERIVAITLERDASPA